eukprot:TRINITY_DN5647_c0_g2_i2.p1 TRINITY_DN5647_c0_g2~~TRINITY_DN5647_c0_g2_i2.p1  ORF type:complete len:367 (+),score=17.93 TRINITY_DN5647_c0_g2_i2:133-1233(+)
MIKEVAQELETQSRAWSWEMNQSGTIVIKIHRNHIDKFPLVSTSRYSTTPFFKGGYRRLTIFDQYQYTFMLKADPKLHLSPYGPHVEIIVIAFQQEKGFRKDNLHCHYDPQPHILNSYFQEKKSGLPNDISMWNGDMWKLKKFNFTDNPLAIHLTFCDTDYFSQMVTDLNTSDPHHKKCLDGTDITRNPVPEFSTILGVNVAIITKDNYVAVSAGGRDLKVGASRYHTSVAENLLRGKSSDGIREPDLFLAASRGCKEELGLDISPEEIKFHTFTVLPATGQYSMLATVKLPDHTKEDVYKSWTRAKDRYEKVDLLFIEYTPQSIAEFVYEHWGSWVPQGLTNIYHSLWMEYDKARIQEAFSDIGY